MRLKTTFARLSFQMESPRPLLDLQEIFYTHLEMVSSKDEVALSRVFGCYQFYIPPLSHYGFVIREGYFR